MKQVNFTNLVVNKGSRPLTIHVEPWGGEYSLNPGEYADVVVERCAEHPVEWEFGDGVLSINSWANVDVMITLWRDGVEIPAR